MVDVVVVEVVVVDVVVVVVVELDVDVVVKTALFLKNIRIYVCHQQKSILALVLTLTILSRIRKAKFETFQVTVQILLTFA